MSEPVAKHRPMIDLDEFERRLRRPAASPPQQGSEDPLAELARLVAGEADPYQNVFETHAQTHAVEPVWEDVEPEPSLLPSQRPTIDFAAIEAGLLRGSMQPDSYAAPVMASEPPAFHAARYPEGDAGWEAAEAPPRSRKPLYMMAGVIVLGIAGIGASFAYKGHTSGPQQIATIMADPGPTKVQPPQAPAPDTTAPNASILDKSASQPAVALADHREEPVDVSQIKSPDPDPAPPAADAVVPAVPDARGVAAPTSAPNPAEFQQPVGIAALIEPKKVKTVSVRPDGTLLPNDTPPQSAAAAPEAPPARPVAIAKPASPKITSRVAIPPRHVPLERHATAERHAATERHPTTARTATTTPLSLSPVDSRPAGRPVRVAEAQPESVHATGGVGTFAVQVAAPASEKEAIAASSRLEHQYASDLAGHQPAIHKAKVGARDVYRVRVGGLSRQEALGMCQKIKASGGKCFVARD